MKRMKNKKKGFFAEFKQFISRGDALNLAIGIIIGGAFTAIVTALTGHILTPLINWLISSIFKGNALESARTVLGKPMLNAQGQIDWDKTLYIDWGAFIGAVINFFLIGLVLFIIVKTINKAKNKKDELVAKQLEKYYEKHPEEKPAPVEQGAPAPTQEELLIQIRDILKEKK